VTPDGDIDVTASNIESIIDRVVDTGEPWVIGAAEPIAVIVEWTEYQALWKAAGR